MLGVEIAGLDVEALMLHLFANSLFFGMLALAIGAITGNKGTATGATTAILVLSFFGVGFLPLIQGGETVSKLLPWYYFDGSDPVNNGVAWGHLVLLGGGSLLLLLAAVVGFNRRDLKGQSVGTTMLDRIRGNPILNKVIGRLAGSARVSSIWLKTASDYQTLVLITAAVMFLVQGVMMGPMYASIPEETLATFDQFPEQLIALFGGGDLSTPEGWYSLETFGLMAPGAVILVTVVMGASALAGEESRRTMALLLACPISRNRIVLEKVIPMVFYAVLVGFITFAGVSIGSLIPDLGMSIGNIAATATLQTLVGLVFRFAGAGFERGDGAHIDCDLRGDRCRALFPPVQLARSAQRRSCRFGVADAVQLLLGQRSTQQRYGLVRRGSFSGIVSDFDRPVVRAIPATRHPAARLGLAALSSGS